MACPLWGQAICGHRADSSILFCQGFSIRNTLINIAVPVLCVWIWTWSSLWLWMCWPCRYQAIHRLRADLLMEHCFVNISVSTCTQISIVDPISCILNWSTLCLCISRPYRCRAIRNRSVDHTRRYCFVYIAVCTWILINTVVVVPVSCIQLDLYSACGCSGPVGARPSTHSELIT